MTTFSTFASSFRFLASAGITDVSTIITDFRSETVTNGSPAWTEPTSQTFKSPVDSAGRFFFVILTRTTATRLQWTIKDQNNITVCDREIDISGTVTVNYYTGQYHAWIESLVASSENAAAGILDASPLPQGTFGNYTYGNGFRNTAGNNDSGFVSTGQLFMVDNGVGADVNRIHDVGQIVSGQTPGLTDAAGNLMYLPVDLTAANSAITRWAGKAYQVVFVDSSVTAGTLKTIVIGNAGETGTFRVLGGTLASTVGARWAVRQA